MGAGWEYQTGGRRDHTFGGHDPSPLGNYGRVT
jgi:hypothetical protein